MAAHDDDEAVPQPTRGDHCGATSPGGLLTRRSHERGGGRARQDLLVRGRDQGVVTSGGKRAETGILKRQIALRLYRAFRLDGALRPLRRAAPPPPPPSGPGECPSTPPPPPSTPSESSAKSPPLSASAARDGVVSPPRSSKV